MKGGVHALKFGIGEQRPRKAHNQNVVVSDASKKDTEALGAMVKTVVGLGIEDAAGKFPQIIVRNMMAADTDAEIVKLPRSLNSGVYDGQDQEEGVKVRLCIMIQEPSARALQSIPGTVRPLSRVRAYSRSMPSEEPENLCAYYVTSRHLTY